MKAVRRKKKKKKKTPEEEAALERARAEVAAAQAALAKAEAALVAARVALEKALAELPEDSELKKEVKRQRDALLEQQRLSNLSPQTQQIVQTRTGGGLQVTTFNTAYGRVVVNLPDDIRAGDTISGTVVAEPQGQTESERATNTNILTGSIVEIQPPSKRDGSSNPRVIAQVAATAKPFSVVLPPKSTQSPPLTGVSSASSGGLGITLTNTGGSFFKPQSTTIPIELVPLSLQSVAPLKPFQLPTIGQAGRPIEIIGPFDGNSSNTTLRRNLTDFEKNTDTENVSGGFGVLAESPRKSVFQSPANVTGPMQISLDEGNTHVTGNFRNVGVNLSAPKTTLRKGERTTLTVEVSGLQGITQPVPLTLESQGVITMEGGMYQPLVIQPSAVGAAGRYSTTRDITGVQTGGWASTATVVTQPFNIVLRDPDPPQTILINSFTGDYVFCSPGFKLSGTGQIKRAGCVITLEDNRTDRRVFGTLDDCTPGGTPYIYNPAGLTTDLVVTVTDTRPPRRNIYFNPLGRPAPPVQDVSAFATCP